jgi:Trypsin
MTFHLQTIILKIVGFGALCFRCASSTDLLELYLPVWSQSECVAAYARRKYPIRATQLCAGFRPGGKDSCQVPISFPFRTKTY